MLNHRNRHFPVWIAALVVLALSFNSRLHAATLSEQEPNNPCQNAQDLGAEGISTQIEGYKALSDVDFFKFTAPAGSRLRLVMNGRPSKTPQLQSAALGLFSSGCGLQTSNAAIGGNAFLDFEVPADGQVIVAATACCDLDFSGSGTLEGWYVLSILNQPSPRPATAMDELYVSNAGDINDSTDDAVMRFLIRVVASEAFQGPALACGPSQTGCFIGPQGILVDNGNMLVVNQNAGLPRAGEIFQYHFNNNAWTFDKALVPYSDANAPWGPRGIIKDGNTLYVANKASADGTPTPQGSLLAYHATTGAFLAKFDTTGFPAAFYPEAVVMGPDRLLYVSVSGDPASADPAAIRTGYVVRFDPATKAFKDIFVNNVALDGFGTKLESPEGLVFGPDNRLYVTSGVDVTTVTTGRILIFDGQSGAYVDKIDLLKAGATKIYAQALAFGPQDLLYVPITWGISSNPLCGLVGNCTLDGELRAYDVVAKSFTTLPAAAPAGPLRFPTYLSFATTDPATLAYKPPITHSLTIDLVGAGRVASGPSGIDCGSTCTYPFNHGMWVSLTATPVAGHSFAGWGGACSGKGSCSIAVDASKSISAVFVLKYALTVSVTGAGSVSSSPAGIDCGAACSHEFDQGASVSLTATPSAGHIFAGWVGACSDTGRCDISVDSVKSVQANFIPTPKHMLSVELAGSGHVSSTPAGIDCGSSCEHAFDQGAPILLTATPPAGYSFSGWSGACSGKGECRLTLNEAAGITASFVANAGSLVSLNVVKTGNGRVGSRPRGISCGRTCNHSFKAPTSVFLTATPAARHRFGGWEGACIGEASRCGLTMNRDQAVVAHFVSINRLSVSKKGRGTVVSDPDGYVDCGRKCHALVPENTVIKLTAIPQKNYDFVRWGGACSGAGTCSVVVNQRTSVRAIFARR